MQRFTQSSRFGWSRPWKFKQYVLIINIRTGKSLSEALIFASTNPQYDRLFFALQVQYMKFRTIYVYNMFSPCSTKIRASDKDLPVKMIF